MNGRPLAGSVALVTGSSKNIGKGIALEVAAAGAAVYLTARTLDDSGPESIGSLRRTAKEIEDAGGTAVPVACDHADDAAVEAVFARIADEHGRLDLLVNVASPDFASMVGKAFWELPFSEIDSCLTIGPRSGYVATALAARMMVPRGQGVVVNVSSRGSQDYLLSVPYGMGKAGIDKLTHDAALELRNTGVAVVSLWPGLVLTEGLLSRTEVGADGKRTLGGLDIAFGESPKFNGKAVVALAADPEIMARAGQCFRSSRLAREYGFAEDDGSLPPEVISLGSYLDGEEQEIPTYWKGVERFAGATTKGEQE